MSTYAPETNPDLEHDPSITDHDAETTEAIDRAEIASEEYREAESNLHRLLTTSLQKVFKIGDVISLGKTMDDRKSNPGFLRRVTTISGNSRNTSLFRIASMPKVIATLPYLDDSVWQCLAVPISEKTGKDMSGNTAGSRQSATVVLQGKLILVTDNVSGPEAKILVSTRLKEFVSWCENPDEEVPSKMFLKIPERTK